MFCCGWFVCVCMCVFVCVCVRVFELVLMEKSGLTSFPYIHVYKLKRPRINWHFYKRVAKSIYSTIQWNREHRQFKRIFPKIGFELACHDLVVTGMLNSKSPPLPCHVFFCFVFYIFHTGYILCAITFYYSMMGLDKVVWCTYHMTNS